MKIQIRNLVWLSGALLAAMVLAQAAVAKPPNKISVTGANPDSALQGEALEVVISGSGFGQGALVKFLVSGTHDDSQITVNSVFYNDSDGTLTANIQVQDAALVSDYDIEVQALSGRKGKGTTLFKVFSNNGGGNTSLYIACDDLFGFAPGTCTAEGSADPCILEKPSNEDRSWQMTQNCDTRAMLIVPGSDPFLLGNGFTLNLVAPWSGDYAAISNSQGAIHLGGIHIVVNDPTVANGCGGPTVQSAVYFDPDLEPTSGQPRGQVVDMVIEAGNGARFCRGIEFVGSDPRIALPSKEDRITGNTVAANSYEEVGIWMANINLSDVNDQTRNELAQVTENIVEASDSPCGIGMLLGPHIERLNADGNLVYASSGAGCASPTAGIVVADSGRNKADPDPDYDFLTASVATLGHNTVQTGGGGSIGIVIDAETSAEMSASQITAGQGSDIGLCVETGAAFDQVRKKSSFIGFDSGNDVVNAADCGVMLP